MEPPTGQRQTQPVFGIEMYYELQGAGEPLVLLHGFTGCSADWRYVFNNPPSGYRLVIPDLRGHGRSTGGAEFTFRQCALDVFSLLDSLHTDRFKAIGLSGGGQVLLHMATQQPHRIEAMVLVSAAHYFPATARDIMRQIAVDNRSESEWQAMRERHKHGDEQIRVLWRLGNAMQDSYDDVNFTSQSLSRISARTLIVHGDRDPLYPINIPLEMHTAIPKSQLWIVPNAGHGPIFGEMTQKFVATALAFLNGEAE